MRQEDLEQARSDLAEKLEESDDPEFLCEGGRRLVDVDRHLLDIAASQPGDAVAWDCAALSLGASLAFLAESCQELDQFDDAEQHYREASLTYENRFGEGHWGVAEAAARIRTIDRIRQLPAEQRQQLKFADRLFEEAASLEKAGQLEDAISRLTRAAAVEREVFGEGSLNYGQTLSWQAGLLKQLEKLEEAAQLYEQSNAILLEHFGETHPHLIDDLESLAVILQELERHSESVELLKRVLAGSERNYGQRSNAYFLTLLQLAGAYDRLQSLEESLALCQEALAVAADLHGESSPAFIVAERRLARVLTATGRWEEAESHYLDALDKLKSEEVGTEINVEYRDCAMEVGDFFGRADKWPRALTVLRELREYFKRIQLPPGIGAEDFDPSDPSVGKWACDNEDLLLSAMRECQELDMLLVQGNDSFCLPPAELMQVENEMLWRMETFAQILEVRGSDSAIKMRELRDDLNQWFQERRRKDLTDFAPDQLPSGELGRRAVRVMRVCLQSYPWPWNGFDQARFQSMSADEFARHCAEIEAFIDRFESGESQEGSWFHSLLSPQPPFVKSLQALLGLAKKMETGSLKGEVFPRLKLQVILFGGFWQCVKLAEAGRHQDLVAMVEKLRQEHGVFAEGRELDEAEDSTYYSIATLRNLILLFEYNALAADATLGPADRVLAASRFLDDRAKMRPATTLSFAALPEEAILSHLARISDADLTGAGVAVDRNNDQGDRRLRIDGHCSKHVLHIRSSGAVSVLADSSSD